MNDATQTAGAGEAAMSAGATAEQPAKYPRLWFPVALVVGYWVILQVLFRSGMPPPVPFQILMGSTLLLIVGFLVWWLASRRISWGVKLAGVAALIGGAAAAMMLADPSFVPRDNRVVGLFMLTFFSMKWVFGAWAVGLLLTRRASNAARGLAVVAALLVAWGTMDMLRSDGLTGNFQFEPHWRWSATAEELYLRDRPSEAHQGGGAGAATAPAVATVTTQPGDWPQFRGPGRDGVVRATSIGTDWNAKPLTLVWKHRIGPGWSGFAVVGDRLYTQEQRDTEEAVVCFDAATGKEIWSHEETVRFWDAQGGAGPRATPTFHDGKIYALGGTGILTCLDAASGAVKWRRELQKDAAAKTQIWGFASSPLVVGDKVIVYAGIAPGAPGDGKKNLLAYRISDGEPTWAAEAGKQSYGSAQLATVGGRDEVMFFGADGLIAFDPNTGAELWRYASDSKQMWRAISPLPVGDAQVLIGSETDFGAALVDVKYDAGNESAAKKWASRSIAPSFSDLVVYRGNIYGLDGSPAVLACVDLATGERRWRKGAFDKGQILLLEDQGLLLVLAEDGQVVLIAAEPAAYRELGRFQAIDGKTWNHPALVRGRLYVRNAQWVACYQMP